MEVVINSENVIKEQIEKLNKKKKRQGPVKKRFFNDTQWKVIVSLIGIGLVIYNKFIFRL
jgi:hypothetical protein